MVARVAAASKCKETHKKLEKRILVGDLKETLFPYVPLSHFFASILGRGISI
jgi:hypothetical protein